MKAVKAEVTSSNPISLSKASTTLSLFAASETGAQPDVSAYLRRAAAAFEELVAVHCEIRDQRKISQVEQKDDGSHRKKKGKETDCEADVHGGNSSLQQQRLGVALEESLGSVPVDANGVVHGKKVNVKEEEKWGRVGVATESVENKTTGKKERKKELSIDEMNSQKVESYGTRKKVDAPKRVSVDTKKRKHSDAEQHEGKKRRR